MGFRDKALPGNKNIRAHFMFDVKHNSRCKARIFANGNLADVSLSSAYSGVVSLRGIHIELFLMELNSLELWNTDIGNAYLEALTKEKVYVIARRGFRDLERHLLIIRKALYGLHSSGIRWNEKLADCLCRIDYFSYKIDPYIWMKDQGSHCDYFEVYMDNLLIASKYPEHLVIILTDKFKFKLKGTGKIKYHLGCDFFRD